MSADYPDSIKPQDFLPSWLPVLSDEQVESFCMQLSLKKSPLFSLSVVWITEDTTALSTYSKMTETSVEQLVQAYCDGGCGKIYFTTEITFFGLCEHFACKECAANGMINDTTGFNSCPNKECLAFQNYKEGDPLHTCSGPCAKVLPAELLVAFEECDHFGCSTCIAENSEKGHPDNVCLHPNCLQRGFEMEQERCQGPCARSLPLMELYEFVNCLHYSCEDCVKSVNARNDTPSNLCPNAGCVKEYRDKTIKKLCEGKCGKERPIGILEKYHKCGHLICLLCVDEAENIKICPNTGCTKAAKKAEERAPCCGPCEKDHRISKLKVFEKCGHSACFRCIGKNKFAESPEEEFCPHPYCIAKVLTGYTLTRCNGPCRQSFPRGQLLGCGKCKHLACKDCVEKHRLIGGEISCPNKDCRKVVNHKLREQGLHKEKCIGPCGRMMPAKYLIDMGYCKHLACRDCTELLKFKEYPHLLPCPHKRCHQMLQKKIFERSLPKDYCMGPCGLYLPVEKCMEKVAGKLICKKCCKEMKAKEPALTEEQKVQILKSEFPCVGTCNQSHPLPEMVYFGLCEHTACKNCVKKTLIDPKTRIKSCPAMRCQELMGNISKAECAGPCGLEVLFSKLKEFGFCGHSVCVKCLDNCPIDPESKLKTCPKRCLAKNDLTSYLTSPSVSIATNLADKKRIFEECDGPCGGTFPLPELAKFPRCEHRVCRKCIVIRGGKPICSSIVCQIQEAVRTRSTMTIATKTDRSHVTDWLTSLADCSIFKPITVGSD